MWIDALVNYLSGPGNGRLDEIPLWNTGARKVHGIGKNVWKFHAVHWPALLLSAGLPLPNEIVVHGFVTVNGRKISKTQLAESAGTDGVGEPLAYVGQYGADAVRYALLRTVPPFRDGDFSEARLAAAYTGAAADPALGLACSSRCHAHCRGTPMST